jgi:hypothetical protein
MMKTNLNCWLVVAALSAAGCMTYDFEPVEPLAVSQTTDGRNVVSKQLKPNIMILLDKSGSMGLPINPGAAQCPSGCGQSTSNPCPANCSTRISELRSAMNTFLTNSGGVARLGLYAYPTNSVCGDESSGTLVPAKLRVAMLTDSNDVPADISAKALEVNTSIQAISASASGDDAVSGGTPTAGSLRLVGEYPTLADKNRENFVLLLTDGLPNCNGQNPITCLNPAACRCTTTSCGTVSTATFCQKGCLDDSGTVDAIRALNKQKIRTVVVGFGSDTSAGGAAETLNAMAEAGGFARTCNPMLPNSGCSDGCDASGSFCNSKFYQASNGAELASALASISDIINKTDPCVFKLASQPTDPSFLTVRIDGQSVNRSDTTWRYENPNVTILGTFCDRIKNATQQAPVNVVIRIVEKL